MEYFVFILYADIHCDELLIGQGTKCERQPSHVLEKDDHILYGESLILLTVLMRHFGVLVFDLEWYVEARFLFPYPFFDCDCLILVLKSWT